MTPLWWALVLGSLGAAGLVLGLHAAVPPAPVDLAAAWNRLAHPTHERRGRLDEVLARATARCERAEHPWLALPTQDLALLSLTPRQHVTGRLLWTLAAAGVTAVAAAALVMAGWGVPVAAALAAIVLAAGVGSLVPVWQLRQRAAAARHECRRVLAVYLDLLAQERTAGQAPGPALRSAAEVGDHWLFTTIRHELVLAEHRGQPAWDALRALGVRWGLDELADVADLAATAADGAAIHTSVTAYAASLRSATISADRAEANARTERLTLPATILLGGFLLLLLYPTLDRLLS